VSGAGDGIGWATARVVSFAAVLAVAWAIARADPVPTPADSAAMPVDRFQALLHSLRARTDSILTPQATRVDVAYRDSVVAWYDSSVAAEGFASFAARHRDPDRDERGGKLRLDVDPLDGDVGYSKVDGLSVQAPLAVWGRARGVEARLGGRGGYAFASDRARFSAGPELAARDVSIGWERYREAIRFGWTNVRGGRLFAIAGADEQDYLERDGWAATIGAVLPGGCHGALSYRSEEQAAMRARDIARISRRNHLFESNAPASEGDLRALGVRITRERDSGPRVGGELLLETSGRGLRGDLDYDRFLLAVSWDPIVPWGDEIVASFAGQMAAGPDTIPNQILADPAGRSGVRGYPHRSIIGSHAILLRLDYHIERDLFALARVPLLRKLRLQLVPFLDVGAAWTPDVNRRLADARLPDSREWKWGVGVGVRKGLGFGELLSHLRFDAAWRLDRGRASPVVYFVLETESFD
jgi:hypothetical protein